MITGFIRSIGERTEKIAYDIISQEIPVEVVRFMPLSESVRYTCEQAIKSGAEWTLFAGADTIPVPGYISRLYEVAKTAPDDVMAVKGWIKDKFLMEMRGKNGGSAIYRTDLLQTWLHVIDYVDNQRTTEARCYGVLKDQGYRFEKTDILVGYHDFEQYYEHIYRSCFVYGKKKKRAKKLLKRWATMAQDDKDFEVCRYAFLKGREYNGSVKADYRIDYGFKESPFVHWVKEPLSELPENIVY
jgi:hypothetical protein